MPRAPARTYNREAVEKAISQFGLTSGENYAISLRGLPTSVTPNLADIRELRKNWGETITAVRGGAKDLIPKLNQLSIEAALYFPALFEQAQQISPDLIVKVIRERINELMSEPISVREKFRLRVTSFGLGLASTKELVKIMRGLPEGRDAPHTAHAGNVLRLFSALEECGAFTTRS